MKLLAECKERVRALVLRRREEAEMDEELRHHLQMETEKNVREGMRPAEARRQAILSFGGVERHKEAVRDARGTRWVEDLWADLRYAIRTFRKDRVTTAVLVGSLAVGIGMATAMFSVVDGVLLRPLPVREQDRVVVMWAQRLSAGWQHVPVSFRDFRTFEERARAFEGLAAIDYNGAFARPVELGDRATKMNVAFVSADLFDVLGAAPELGRLLRPDDGHVGANPVVVISHGLWRREFGADPAVLGSSLSVYGHTATIVGVTPLGFDFPTAAEVWAPIMPFTARAGRDSSWVYTHMVGRIAAGASDAQAAAELDAFVQDESARFLAAADEMRGVATPLIEVVAGELRPAIVALSAAVALLLLIMCANTASLLLLRVSTRRQELATRISLGAGRWRIARQVFVESGLLVALGGVLSVAVAWWAVTMLVALAPAEFPRLDEIGIDGRALAFGAATACLAAILLGLAPVAWAARTSPSAAHRRSQGAPPVGPGLDMGLGAERTKKGLVVCQVALALVVLTAAGLVTRSFRNLQRLDLGVARKQVILVELTPSAALDDSQGQEQGSSRAERLATFDELVARAQALPRVVAATVALMPPFTGRSGWDAAYLLEGQSEDGPSTNPLLNLLTASPTYFETFGIPILRGRAFTEGDHQDAPPVAVVSEAVARRAWAGKDAVGQRLRVAGVWRTVVGVAGDTRYRSLRQVHPSVYVPVQQSQLSPTLLAVRAETDAAALIPALRQVVERTAPWLYVAAASTIARRAATPLARPRLNSAFFSGFGLVALLLNAIGLYGIVAAYVREREREIGIRTALGAPAGSVLWLVVRQGGRLAVLGLAIGSMLAFALTRLISSLLFGVTPTDPVTFTAVAILVAGVALLASYLPARRATKVDPMSTLRCE